MTEKQIENKLKKIIKQAGGISYKFNSPGNSGVPDRIVILPDRSPIFVELKTKSGRLSAVQRYQHKILNLLGQEVIVVQGEKDLEEFEDWVGAVVEGYWERR